MIIRYLRSVLIMLLGCLLFSAGTPVQASADEAADEPLSEWTVLFYFCGSDLESQYGYATASLLEIMETDFMTVEIPELRALYGMDETDGQENSPRSVNVLVETGGASAWKSTNPVIDPGKLERWIYDPTRRSGSDESSVRGTLQKASELPSASMADPETLADFIRWGSAAAPAEKYALVLWDHGGGSKTGIFADELYGWDIMYLNELSEAMRDGGVHFESVIIDACMMANVETAYVLSPYASWLTASEELVPGMGTAIRSWLQELMNNPGMDGRQLGHVICDMTQAQYSNLDKKEDRGQAVETLTWSVIRLDRVEQLVQAIDAFYELTGRAYSQINNYEYVFSGITELIRFAEKFGDCESGMVDIGSIFFSPETAAIIAPEVRTGILTALTDAVDYNLKGPGRAALRGISFCSAAHMTPEEMEVYARNCPFPHYLAMMDALSDWEASDSVYEKAERLPYVGDVAEYNISLDKILLDGIPAYSCRRPGVTMYYSLYRTDEETGAPVRLGKTLCRSEALEEGGSVWVANDPMHWAALEGVHCDMEIVFISGDTIVYNIPVRIGKYDWILRCGRDFDRLGDIRSLFAGDPGESSFTVYGLWEGYDSDSSMPSRNVETLAELAGREYEIVLPLAGMDGKLTGDGLSQPAGKLPRILNVREEPLEPGTYYLQYELEDSLRRSVSLTEMIPVTWDGETVRLADGYTWEGTVEIEDLRH